MCYDPLSCVSERFWFLFESAAWIFLELRLWSLFWSLFCVSLLSVCPFICCPSNRVFTPRKEDSMSQGFISRCCGFQQFGCLGILSRWVATLTSMCRVFGKSLGRKHQIRHNKILGNLSATVSSRQRVKYVYKSCGARNQKSLCWRGPAAIQQSVTVSQEVSQGKIYLPLH
jgi:hypothetical protein